MSFFAEFDFEIVYRPGDKNTNAHFLSRSAEEEKVLMVLNVGLEASLEKLYSYLNSGIAEASTSEERRHTKIRANNYLLFDGEMYRRTIHSLRFIPRVEERMRIIKGLHDEIGHWDFRTTDTIMGERFWWPTMRQDVAHFVRSCYICQKMNPPEQHRPFGKLPVS